ncbi:cyclopropane-fatty-acyl-phospholipid synthase [Tuber magnatum]|uniref:Cyclopropane-fatty-acyl-phospholipid synthase n=1 Tax=Tuber magnatum TaxID=42249 RepID=A0A317SPW6_9PEZI|nr:cyclopropane-fatty-acyl-phospholipid synthase [Tuber magnatum]
MNTLTAVFGYARRVSGSIAWEPLVRVCMRAVLTLLGGIEDGRLVVTFMDGRREVFGGGGGRGGPQVELTVLKEMFWVRLFLFADLGFSEAYMLREVDCSDLVDFFQIFIQNRLHLSNSSTISSILTNPLPSLLRSTNNLQNSLLNVSAHYDISNEIFAAFLSPDMTYSCAIFPPSPTDPPATATTGELEAAQYTKLCRIITSAKIKSTDHVLEIGTGWGSFAMEAVARTGCRVTSITLSMEQKALAEERIAAAGMADKITVLLCDYRALPVQEKRFDKIVSIEMLEAVGGEYLEKYFQVIDCVLKRDGGIAVFQCITIPEGRHETYTRGNDFIRKYIFPGGHLPSNTQLVNAVNKGSNGNLVLESVENIGGHYTRTLRFWRENFLGAFHHRIAPALRKEHPEMSEEDVDVFNRKWEYYFAYCEAGFKAKFLNDIIFTIAREGAMELYEGIPL